MKKRILTAAVLLALCLSGCAGKEASKAVPESFADGQSVQEYLLEQNAAYRETNANAGNISADKRADTASNGQHPYAVVVTCSDSRVPAEHIFNAGIEQKGNKPLRGSADELARYLISELYQRR